MAFVTKFNAMGTAIIYSTYLGANQFNNSSSANSIAVDSVGNAFVTGSTRAPDFPILNARQPTISGNGTSTERTLSSQNLVRPEFFFILLSTAATKMITEVR